MGGAFFLVFATFKFGVVQASKMHIVNLICSTSFLWISFEIRRTIRELRMSAFCGSVCISEHVRCRTRIAMVSCIGRPVQSDKKTAMFKVRVSTCVANILPKELAVFVQMWMLSHEGI